VKLATLQKLGGIALIAGSALFAAYSVLLPALLPVAEARRDLTLLVQTPWWTWLALVALAGISLMLFGFAAVYVRIYARSGALGLLGFVFVELAYVLQGAKVTWELCLYPVIARHEAAAALLRNGVLFATPRVAVFRAVSSLTILIGIVLFCFALVRSTEFPKASGVLVFAGALMYGAGPVLGIRMAGVFVLALGCVVLGVALVGAPAAGRETSGAPGLEVP